MSETPDPLEPDEQPDLPGYRLAVLKRRLARGVGIALLVGAGATLAPLAGQLTGDGRDHGASEDRPSSGDLELDEVRRLAAVQRAEVKKIMAGFPEDRDPALDGERIGRALEASPAGREARRRYEEALAKYRERPKAERAHRLVYGDRVAYDPSDGRTAYEVLEDAPVRERVLTPEQEAMGRAWLAGRSPEDGRLGYLDSPGAADEVTLTYNFFRAETPDVTTARLAFAAWLEERAAEYHADRTRPVKPVRDGR